ncbi:MAG TPA: hypothetical protein VFE60_10860 [Roseiarcus sp.]|nr:hypothetical protein [Roseiarcus sp.]
MPVSQIPTTKTAYADERLRGNLHPQARKLITTLRGEILADLYPEAVGRTVRNKMLGVGPTRGRELELTLLPAYLEGTVRLTRTSDIYRYLIDRALESFPLTGPKKGRGSPHLPPRVEPAYASAHVQERAPASQADAPAPNPSPGEQHEYP